MKDIDYKVPKDYKRPLYVQCVVCKNFYNSTKVNCMGCIVPEPTNFEKFENSENIRSDVLVPKNESYRLKGNNNIHFREV